ncbi:MAG: M56 family metallopeptidase [Maricaulaceae bacterium]
MGPHLNHVLDSLGWALLHSLWQGIAILMGVIFFRLCFRNSGPALRYNVQFGALLLCLAAFAITFALYYTYGQDSLTFITVMTADNLSANSVPTGLMTSDQTGITPNTGMSERLSLYAPLLGIMWCLGFILMTLRYFGAYALTQKLRTQGRHDVSAMWSNRFRTLVLNSGLPSKIRLYVSDHVAGPLTLGFIRPIVLVPASFLTQLPHDQIEAILLHELAHIRRYDYLVNLLQSAIKTIFFFHPAVHYMSKLIDIDREQACDDFAVAQTHNPTALAMGLAALRLNLPRNSFAMTANGKDMPLLSRLKRLAGSEEQSRRPEHILMSALSTLLIGGIYFSTTTVADAHPDASNTAAALNDSAIIEQLASAADPIKHPKAWKHNYRFETIRVKERQITAKIAEDGSRWVNVDGHWVDIDKSPDIVSQIPTGLPTPPMPPMVSGHSLGLGMNVPPGFEHKMAQFEIDMQYFEADIERYNKAQAYKKAEISMNQTEVTQVQVQRHNAQDALHTMLRHAEEQRERATEYDEAMRKYNDVPHDVQRARHEAFKSKLLDMLIEDGVIASRTSQVKIKYPGYRTMVNGVDVVSKFGGKYCDLWDEFNIPKNQSSYIKITPKSYMLKTKSYVDGTTHQTTYGEWNDASLSPSSPPSPPIIPTHHSLTQALPNFIMPTPNARITSTYGTESKLRTNKHKGIDLAAKTGADVLASADGTVFLLTTEPSWGNRIIIKHEDGFQTHYGHLKGFNVKRGTKVKAGDVIGYVGSTGKTTGPHLHFEIRKNGHTLDPQSLLM